MTTVEIPPDLGVGNHHIIMNVNGTIAGDSMPRYHPLISAETTYIISFINRLFICQPLALFGVGTNVINVIVFYKMRFKESINVSLCALALSDFCTCLTAFWVSFCYTSEFLKFDLPYKPTEVMYITGGGPHMIAIRMTGIITTFIATERCLCISFPLKVKNIVTPKRVFIIIISCFVVFVGLYAPDYYINRLAWKFYPNINKTLIGLVYAKEKVEIENVLFPIRGPTVTFLTFFVTCVSTTITVVILKKRSDWRKKTTATSASKQSQMSARDTKVTTLMVSVSTIYIMCYAPYTIVSCIMVAEPEFSLGGRYHNAFMVNFNFLHVFSSLDGSINIFVYYFRSSKYKETFQNVFPFMKSAKKASGKK